MRCGRDASRCRNYLETVFCNENVRHISCTRLASRHIASHFIGKVSGIAILVTGHKGYIGTVMVPCCSAPVTLVGLDSDLFQQCTFTPGIHDIPDFARPSRRPAEAPRRFDAVSLAALSNDRWGSEPENHLRHQHTASARLASLRRRRRARFLYLRPAAATAGGDDLVDETAACGPSLPTPIQGAGRAGRASSPMTSSARRSCATRRPTGLASLRFDSC